MKITKYTHACLVIEDQGQRLVIDPGEWSTDLVDLSNIVAVVVTHVHADHCDPARIQAIQAANPTVQIYGPDEVVQHVPAVTPVKASDDISAGPFRLRFYGERHALVHADKPQNQNIGVAVNDTFYYPGDSFTMPQDTQIKILALPVSGPWLKLGEAMDFVIAAKPQLCIPTHNAMLAEAGMTSVDGWLNNLCAEQGTTYLRLNPTESTDISETAA